MRRKCSTCRGVGKIASDDCLLVAECPRCGGVGRVEVRNPAARLQARLFRRGVLLAVEQFGDEPPFIVPWVGCPLGPTSGVYDRVARYFDGLLVLLTADVLPPVCCGVRRVPTDAVVNEGPVAKVV